MRSPYSSSWHSSWARHRGERRCDTRNYGEYTDALKSGDPRRIAESGKRISEWSKEPYALKVIALEDEARRLIGTKRHWRSTRRGRVVVWLRQNIDWLAAVPLLVFFVILAGLVVYSLVAG